PFDSCGEQSRVVLRALLTLVISISRSALALFRSREDQAIVELALRQQRAVYVRRYPETLPAGPSLLGRPWRPPTRGSRIILVATRRDVSIRSPGNSRQDLASPGPRRRSHSLRDLS